MDEAARPATVEDAPVVEALAAAARAGLADQRGGEWWVVLGTPHRWEAGFVADALDDPDTYLAVGTLDGVVVGYVLARIVEVEGSHKRLCVVDELYVQPEARSVSVGELLMDGVLAVAADRGCAGVDAVALPGDRATKNFFERFGLVARAIVVHRPLGPES